MWVERDTGAVFGTLEQFSVSGFKMRAFGAFGVINISMNGKVSFKPGGFGFVEGPNE